MALHDPSLKLTYEDYVLMLDDGRRHEIIDGRHYVSPSPSSWHQELAYRLVAYFVRLLDKNPLGRLLFAPMDTVFSRYDVVQPDLLFIAAERKEVVKKNFVQGAPDLVIEILSESTRRLDQFLKLELYERFGVKEYWLIDPFRRAITVYRWDEGRFLRAADLQASDAGLLTSPLLPGLEISLAELFEGEDGEES